MKFLIACLGNPGTEYDGTRHNIGFAVGDAMARAAGAEWRVVKHGLMAEVKHRGRTLLLLKPTTFMNLSGKAVAHHLLDQTIPRDRLVVVLDDLAIPFGTLRLRPGGANAGHNGLKDIDLLLKTQDYARLRFGVGADYPRGRQVDFVLSPFSKDEQLELPALIDRAAEALQCFAFQGLAPAMTQYNKNWLSK
jgi:PTH1 family peptidyl-tRNA hydrolase